MVILGIVIATFLTGAIAVTTFKTVIDRNNKTIMLHQCRESAESLNKSFSEAESWVNTLSTYYLEHLDSPQQLADEAFLSLYTKEAGSIAYSIVNNNPSITSAFFRLAPELTNPLAGFFVSRSSETGEVTYMEPTDLSMFDASDFPNVGWYYVPLTLGEAVWLDPYLKPNSEQYILSYVKPLYIEDVFIGVVGIDLNYDKIRDELSSISLFESGYAILMDANETILFSEEHQPILPEDTVSRILNGGDDYVYSSYLQGPQLYNAISHKLNTGEYLILLVPELEIYTTRNQMIFTIILVAIAVGTAVILILTGMVNHIFDAAHIDKLTGAKNRNAYHEKVDVLDTHMRKQTQIPFSVLIFDINGLKRINDTAGHAEGDRMIQSCYDFIRNHFSNMNIYRIGGDEFVIILEKHTAEIARVMASDFRAAAAENTHSQAASHQDHPPISCGYAVYNPQTDANFEDTFKRADADMYQDKQRFYHSHPELVTPQQEITSRS